MSNSRSNQTGVSNRSNVPGQTGAPNRMKAPSQTCALSCSNASNQINTPNQIGKNVKCSCRGYNLDKLIQPNILIILAKQNLHGYSIIQELESKNLFVEERVDNTGVYRALKTLEDREMIRFEWVLDQSGPAKKNYMITEKGLECLANWIRTLEDYKKSIEKIIEDAKSVLLED